MNKDMQDAIDKGWVSLFNENPRLKQQLQMMDKDGLQSIYGDRPMMCLIAEQHGLKEYQVEKFIRITLTGLNDTT